MEKGDAPKGAPAYEAYADGEEGQVYMSKDEAHLASMGYKQEFFRHLGLFESWAAIFSSINFISGIPVLFGWIMYTGGPTPAFTNWTMVGSLPTVVSLSMAEIAAAMPVAGGIYYWAYRLGGEKWGPFLLWMTAWWNRVYLFTGVPQDSTNFLLGALEISYPNAEVVYKGWFALLLTAIGMFFAMAPNIISQRVLRLYFRFATFIFFTLFLLYWVWFPAKTAASGQFQSRAGVFNRLVAFSAIIATVSYQCHATIATNFSYLIPIVARHIVCRKNFKPAMWNLGRFTIPLGIISGLYILFLIAVLLLPQLYPVTSETLNYAPICIGIVTIVSLVGWMLPFGLGGMYWFHGPKKTIEQEDSKASGVPVTEELVYAR